MANPEHLALLMQGVEVWNLWREAHPSVQPDLAGADLHKCDLDVAIYTHPDVDPEDYPPDEYGRRWSADPYGVDLKGALLRGCDLRELQLTIAELDFADLSQADLSGAELELASARGACFRGADLMRTHFRSCDVSEADFSDARMADTIVSDVDLSLAIGLEDVDHRSPSLIAVDTLIKSRGDLPKAFLQGAGFPDSFISNLKTLIGAMDDPSQFHSCFISYSVTDQSFCDKVYEELRTNHLRVWRFAEDATWGKPIWREIDIGITTYDRVIVICSKNSLQSGPVLREIERALQREDREGKNVLFPIRIDNYLFDEWNHPLKGDVVAKVVGDFIGWDQDAKKQKTAFERLLKGLRAEA
jgi:uncharacterized protein YjbI with pentapeptide repeats